VSSVAKYLQNKPLPVLLTQTWVKAILKAQPYRNSQESRLNASGIATKTQWLFPLWRYKDEKKLTDHLLGDPISKFNAPPSKHC
jgi:hypothetical protein